MKFVILLNSTYFTFGFCQGSINRVEKPNVSRKGIAMGKAMKEVGRDLKTLRIPERGEIGLIEIPSQLVTADMLAKGATALEIAKANLLAKKDRQRQEEEKRKEERALFYESLIEFEKWMVDLVLPQIAEIDQCVAEVGKGLLDEEYVMESGDEAATGQKKQAEDQKKIFTVGDRLKELRAAIDVYSQGDYTPAALSVEATEIAFWLSTKPFTKMELLNEVGRLVKANVLVSDRNGDVKVFGDSYAIHGRFNNEQLEEPHRTRAKAKIKDAVRSQNQRIKNEYFQEMKLKTAEFIGASTLPVIDALDETKTGMCGALVSGGAVLFRVDADSIEIIDAVGAPASANGFALLKAVNETYPDNQVRVIRNSLKLNGRLARPDESPRFISPPEISKDRDMSDQYIKAGKFAWHTVRSAIKKAQDDLRKTTEGLLPDEFHKQEYGKYKPTTKEFVHKVFEGSKVLEETSLASLDLEVERFQKPESRATAIRIVTYNQEFRDLMDKNGCTLGEEYPEGERGSDQYNELPQLLKRIIQRDFHERIESRQEEISKKAAKVVNGKRISEPDDADVADTEEEGDPNQELSFEEFRDTRRPGCHKIHMDKWTHKFPGGKIETVHDLTLDITRLKGGEIQVVDFSRDHEKFLDKAGALRADPFPPDNLPTLLWNIFRVYVASANAGNGNGNGTKTGG